MSTLNSSHARPWIHCAAAGRQCAGSSCHVLLLVISAGEQPAASRAAHAGTQDSMMTMVMMMMTMVMMMMMMILATCDAHGLSCCCCHSAGCISHGCHSHFACPALPDSAMPTGIPALCIVVMDPPAGSWPVCTECAANRPMTGLSSNKRPDMGLVCWMQSHIAAHCTRQ